MRNQDLVRITEPEIAPIAAKLHHQLTMLSEVRHATSGRPAGLTIWTTPDRSASLYWNWVMTEEGSPVLADPLAIKSNLLFAPPDRPATYDDQVIGINMLVRALPWQEEVMGHLARLRLSAGRAERAARIRSKAPGASPRVAIAA